MDATNNTLSQFTERLASPAPVPGGGGASALVGAVGIALGDMVGELTVGKKRYADVEEEVKALMEQAQALRVQLLACIEKDAEAFAPLAKAYGIPKDDPSRETVMERCLRDAAAAPLEIFDLCRSALTLLEAFSQKGSKLVLSDAATGAMFCKAAMEGAAINVKVNTKLMRDRAYAAAIDARIDAGLRTCRPLADRIFESVYGPLC